MISFGSDYVEGASPLIMERLLETNMEQTIGYGEDPYCEKAREAIKKACNNESIAVHFLVGGTQANLTVIAAALRPWEGVIAATTGHINVHETGAIEGTGHKVLTLSHVDGKISASQVEQYMKAYEADEAKEHVVKPGMVYISSPTELGTIYNKKEIIRLREVCRRYGLLLYLDGARLGYGLACEANDLDLPFLSQYTDAFYIGGTKVGALFGEAVVLSNDGLKKDFRHMIKQRGGMLAKGRLLGIQFLTMFENGLYEEMGRHGVAMAQKLAKGFLELGIPFLTEPVTNQLFVILPNILMHALLKDFVFETWEVVDEFHTAVRFCTSWGTKEQNVNSLIDAIRRLE